MPTPRGHGSKLTIELLPSKVAPTNTNVNVPVISSQISTVGRTSNFYIQLIPSKSVEKFETLPMSYVLMTNGRITLTGEFHIEPTKECQTKTVRTIRPEEQTPPTCVFNGTLPIEITRDMIPYSTLLVYTFQPSFGFNVAESYRFSVAGLFQNSLTLNATIVPFTSTETIVDNWNFMKEWNITPIHISNKVQSKTCVELSFTGVPQSTVGLNVFEYDGVLQGLSNEITKERLLKYLTTYEQVPFVSMPTTPLVSEIEVLRSERQIFNQGGPGWNNERPQWDNRRRGRRSINEQNEEEQMNPNEMKLGMPTMPLVSKAELLHSERQLKRNGRQSINEQDEEKQMKHEQMVIYQIILFLFLLLFYFNFRVIKFVIQLKKWFLVLVHYILYQQLKVMIFIQHQIWNNYMVI